MSNKRIGIACVIVLALIGVGVYLFVSSSTGVTNKFHRNAVVSNGIECAAIGM